MHVPLQRMPCLLVPVLCVALGYARRYTMLGMALRLLPLIYVYAIGWRQGLCAQRGVALLCRATEKLCKYSCFGQQVPYCTVTACTVLYVLLMCICVCIDSHQNCILHAACQRFFCTSAAQATCHQEPATTTTYLPSLPTTAASAWRILWRVGVGRKGWVQICAWVEHGRKAGG
jgi:hypothetical protein